MTVQRQRRRLAGGLITAGLVAILTLTGCSAGSTNSSGASDNNAAPQNNGGAANGAPQNNGGVASAPLAQGDQSQKQGTPGQPPTKVDPVATRSLIYSGTMTVRVDDVTKAANHATDIAVGAGGVIGSDHRTIDADRSEAELALRVPADKFSAVLDELGKLGVEEARDLSTEDVTEAIIDVNARLATQKASVERVRALLARAQSLTEIASIEAEVTRREADLASLQQRKDRLAGLVSLSTITLRLHGPAVTTATSTPDTGFVAGLKSGWKGFLASVKIVLTVLGWLLPWAIVIGAPIWLIVWLVRRRRPAPRRS